MSISAILFDLDNTLLDRDGAWKAYWSHFIHSNPEIFGTDTQKALDQIIEEDHHGWRDRPGFFSWLVESFPKLTQSPMELWNQCGKQLARIAQPYPGSQELLTSLKKQYSLALISNGASNVQRAKLANSGLGVYFDHIFISGEVGYDKPDARIFSATLKSVNHARENILFVGDDPVRDMLGARNAQLRTCWISHGQCWNDSEPAPEFILGKVTELPSLLQKLRSPG